ncbi:MAG: Imm49 family immunity protein, partial [Myxococcota bacterium]
IQGSPMHPVQAQVIAPIAQCLGALEHDDPQDFEQGWTTLTTAFATVAQHGDVATRFEGMLDPMALGLLVLARRRGFAITVTSPYAPVELITASNVSHPPDPVGAA